MRPRAAPVSSTSIGPPRDAATTVAGVSGSSPIASAVMRRTQPQERSRPVSRTVRPEIRPAGWQDAAMTTLELLEHVARGAGPPPPDAGDRERIAAARAVIDDALAEGTAVYGVTTGFGRLASVRIAAADAARLQVNLVRS